MAEILIAKILQLSPKADILILKVSINSYTHGEFQLIFVR